MDDGLLEFSGESPDDVISANILTADEVFPTLNNDSTVVDITTTQAPLSPYSPNFYRIGFLTTKCLLSLLVLCLTAAIRKRDFLKVMSLLFLLPILLECGLDVYTQIKTSTLINPIHPLEWTLYQPARNNESLSSLAHHALSMYEDMLVHYTGYDIYHTSTWISLASFALSDLLFWSSLYISIIAFFYSHKAITRPEEISYIYYSWSYAKCLSFPVLLTILDTLVSLFSLPPQVSLPSTALLRLMACVAAFTILTQIFLSLFVFCATRDEYTKSSPYEQVRNSKWRLLWFIFFQIVLLTMNAPHIAWSGISLLDDFSTIFGLSVHSPVGVAYFAFVAHISLLPVRALVIPLAILLLLVPYRKRLVKAFCPCCVRK